MEDAKVPGRFTIFGVTYECTPDGDQVQLYRLNGAARVHVADFSQSYDPLSVLRTAREDAVDYRMTHPGDSPGVPGRHGADGPAPTI